MNNIPLVSKTPFSPPINTLSAGIPSLQLQDERLTRGTYLKMSDVDCWTLPQGLFPGQVRRYHMSLHGRLKVWRDSFTFEPLIVFKVGTNIPFCNMQTAFPKQLGNVCWKKESIVILVLEESPLPWFFRGPKEYFWRKRLPFSSILW